jgi:hypothetical protein
MAQIFHRSTNTLSKVSIFGAVFALGFLLWVFAKLDRSTYNTRQGLVRTQPVPFSHDHHVVALGIDCRYCHSSVETAASAGIPPTSTCMNCHKQIWAQSPMLEPVRESWRTGKPIEWTRVHDLPDFVYFDHSIHVAKGVACVTCHGRVDQMPLMYQASSLQMEWCLACHRDTAKYTGPREAVFRMPGQVEPTANVQPHSPGHEVEAQFAAQPAHAAGPAGGETDEYRVRQLTSCSTCHR